MNVVEYIDESSEVVEIRDFEDKEELNEDAVEMFREWGESQGADFDNFGGAAGVVVKFRDGDYVTMATDSIICDTKFGKRYQFGIRNNHAFICVRDDVLHITNELGENIVIQK